MYDYIIVGVTIPGLFLASMLARTRQRVLVIERQQEAGGRISSWRRSGYLSFQGIPRVRYGEKGAFATICRQIGLPIHFEPMNQAWVLDTDGKLKRITVGKPGSLMGDFLSPWDRFSAMRALAGLTDEKLEDLDGTSLEAWFVKNKIRPSFRKYLQVIACEATHGTDLKKISAGETLRCFRKAYQCRSYLAYPSKGWMDVLDRLRQEVEGKAEIRWETSVEGIEARNGRVTGVLAAGQMIEAACVICAIPCQKMIRLLPADATTGEYRRLCEQAVPSAALIVDMALTRRIFRKKGLWFFLDPPSYGTFLSNLSHMHAPAGKQLATFVCPCSQEEARQGEFIQALEKKIEENIRAALPGKELAVEWIRSHTERVMDSIAIRSDQTRADRPGYAVPGLENLFLVGDSTSAPGCCWDMEYESVQACYDKITGMGRW